MYDTFFLYTAAAQMVQDRVDDAERLRRIRQAHAQRKAWTRIWRAIDLARQEGLDKREVAHEFATRLGQQTWN